MPATEYKPGVVAFRHAASPDGNQAVELLHQIAGRSSACSARPVNKPLALYGAGDFGKLAMEYCRRLDIQVSFVVDANPHRYRTDRFWQGVSILGLDEIADGQIKNTLLAICVGKSPYTEVVAPLYARGWRDVVPFYSISAAYLDRHPLGNGWFTGDFTQADISGIESVLLNYDDNMSRAHHLQFLAWHKLHEEWFFDDAPVLTDNRYFIPEIVSRLHADEVFVDMGAHHGNIAAEFIRTVDRQFKQLWALEPDQTNLSALRENMDKFPPALREKIHVLPYAVGRENSSRAFYAGLDFASQLCSYGGARVEVRSLDTLGICPTCMKVHLEGAEMDALLGAVNCIRKSHPLIALTVYHNRLGMWECQKTLMDEFAEEGYKFLFRLHSWHGTGAVLYLVHDSHGQEHDTGSPPPDCGVRK
jgi:FkbM family methyltransferase